MKLCCWVKILVYLSALIWCTGITGGTGGDGEAGGTARQELALISFHDKEAPDAIPLYLSGKDVYYEKIYNNTTWSVKVVAYEVNNSTTYTYKTYKNGSLEKNVSIEYLSWYIPESELPEIEPRYSISFIGVILTIIGSILAFILSYGYFIKLFKRKRGGKD
jgi:hypothetical protein